MGCILGYFPLNILRLVNFAINNLVKIRQFINISLIFNQIDYLSTNFSTLTKQVHEKKFTHDFFVGFLLAYEFSSAG